MCGSASRAEGRAGAMQCNAMQAAMGRQWGQRGVVFFAVLEIVQINVHAYIGSGRGARMRDAKQCESRVVTRSVRRSEGEGEGRAGGC